MKDLKAIILAILAGVAVTTLIVTIFEQDYRRERAECALKDGVLVQGFGNRLCIDSSVVKP